MKSILHYFRRVKRPTPFYSGSTRQGKVNYRMPETNQMKKWQFYVSVVTIGGFGLFSLYPLIVDPLLHENEYKRRHELIQTELFQSGLLPGQLKKWEDPWKKSTSTDDK